MTGDRQHARREDQWDDLLGDEADVHDDLDVFGFELAAEHMDSLNGLDDGTRYRPDPATYTGI